MAKETNMNTKATKKLVREGDFVAEVDVNLVDAEGGWAQIGRASCRERVYVLV